MTPGRFSQIGEQLYGPSWRGLMADALKVGYRTVTRWATGGTETPYGIEAELATLCRDKAAALTKAAEQLERSGGPS